VRATGRVNGNGEKGSACPEHCEGSEATRDLLSLPSILAQDSRSLASLG